MKRIIIAAVLLVTFAAGVTIASPCDAGGKPPQNSASKSGD